MAKPKFKIGDRVRVIPHAAYRDKEFEIMEVWGLGLWGWRYRLAVIENDEIVAHTGSRLESGLELFHDNECMVDNALHDRPCRHEKKAPSRCWLSAYQFKMQLWNLGRWMLGIEEGVQDCIHEAVTVGNWLIDR